MSLRLKKMPPRSSLSIAKQEIVIFFDTQQNKVFGSKQLEQILADNREKWRISTSTRTSNFIEFLEKNSTLKTRRFRFPNRPTIRYTWDTTSEYELVQSLRPNCYFTHYTAMYFHGLTEQIPKTIYLNFEQNATGGGGSLEQANINRAFKSKCRVSKNIAKFGDRSICLLNGQNTGQLGVIDFELNDGTNVRVTNIERNLIDIVVRPVYSGGVFEVAKAYSEAQSKFSVNKLLSYLKKMNFTYPYHQAIGFYLERSGRYEETQISLFREIGMDFDFYLTHKMVETDYVKEWRLFVPKGF